jgi:hypothetical protein
MSSRNRGATAGHAVRTSRGCLPDGGVIRYAHPEELSDKGPAPDAADSALSAPDITISAPRPVGLAMQLQLF